MSYDVFAQVYDRLTENVDYPSMARFIRDVVIEKKPDASLLLDMACGTGTLAVELDKLGFDVTGADSSIDMLTAAREKSGENILYLCQKMEKLDMYGTMSAIVCTLDSINHVTSEKKLKEIFRRAALFLDDDGVFVFDANTQYKHREILANNVFIYDMDDVYCVWQNRTDNDLLTEIELDFFVRNDSQEMYERMCESFNERAYSDRVIEDMLSNAGFRVADRYDGYTYSAPVETTQRIVYVCVKI